MKFAKAWFWAGNLEVSERSGNDNGWEWDEPTWNTNQLRHSVVPSSNVSVQLEWLPFPLVWAEVSLWAREFLPEPVSSSGSNRNRLVFGQNRFDSPSTYFDLLLYALYIEFMWIIILWFFALRSRRSTTFIQLRRWAASRSPLIEKRMTTFACFWCDGNLQFAFRAILNNRSTFYHFFFVFLLNSQLATTIHLNLMSIVIQPQTINSDEHFFFFDNPSMNGCVQWLWTSNSCIRRHSSTFHFIRDAWRWCWRERREKKKRKHIDEPLLRFKLMFGSISLAMANM